LDRKNESEVALSNKAREKVARDELVGLPKSHRGAISLTLLKNT